MYAGRLVYSQLIDHLPVHTFRRCAQSYRGNHKVKSFTCLDQYLCMAFAQRLYRESLRDIQAFLRSQHNKLYHMGIRCKNLDICVWALMPVCYDVYASANSKSEKSVRKILSPDVS